MTFADTTARPRRIIALAAAAAALALSAQAAGAAVVPGDTFTFDIAGFDSTGSVGYILGEDYSAVFGTTATIAGAGYDGQDYTISSSEVVGATTTTDSFTITTPTNFLFSDTIDGTTITALQFDIGDADSGVTFGGVADPVNFSAAISSYTSTGDIVYDGGNSFTLLPSVSLASGGLSFAAAEGVGYIAAISGIAVNEFDFSITYANPIPPIPETGTWAMLLAGLGMTGLFARRSRRG